MATRWCGRHSAAALASLAEAQLDVADKGRALPMCGWNASLLEIADTKLTSSGDDFSLLLLLLLLFLWLWLCLAAAAATAEENVKSIGPWIFPDADAPIADASIADRRPVVRCMLLLLAPWFSGLKMPAAASTL